ncbi:MAG: T9SS type A sorting domain-containing protein [Bacteroidia bacterium]
MFSQKSTTYLGVTYIDDQEIALKTDGALSVKDGTNAIQTSYTVSGCGVNFVATSVRLCKRGGAPAGVTQPATFSVSGIPSCATIKKAVFYTGGSGSGPTINLSFTNPAATNSVFPMVACGFSSTDKWGGYGGTWCRRADVTALISGNGNYIISGIPTGSPNDPDGGTLIIIYSDITQTYTGSMVLADGVMATGGPGNLNSVISGFNVCANPTLTQHFIIAGDLQSLGPYNVRFNSLANNYTYPTASQQFYDYIPFTGAAVTAGQTTANYGLNNASGDAYAMYAAGLYYQTGCSVCTPTVCVVLPIELASFDAACADNAVNLTWTTVTERNNKLFSILRSEDGLNFDEIATIAGSGNSSSEKQYTYTDHRAEPGKIYYYKLRQTDFSNTETDAGKIIYARCAEKNNILEALPNPAGNELYLVSENDLADVSIKISDGLGQQVKIMDNVTLAKNERLTIDIHDLINGCYQLVISGNETLIQKKIIVYR